jgi:hypothetical protein
MRFSFPSFTLGPPSLRFLLDPPSALQGHNIMPTKSAALPYDLNRARFVGLEAEKTGRLDAHTVPMLVSSTPQSQSHLTRSETERSGVFPSHN